MVRAMLWLLALICLARPSLAQDEGEPLADPQNVAEVLTELDNAGTPATEAEIAEFLAETQRPAHGYWLARAGWLQGGGWDQSSRLRWSNAGLDLRGKWRRTREGVVASGAAARLTWGPVEFGIGQLGFAQGFGLLVAGPGRGPALTADGGLGARARSLILWGGEAEKQTLLGFALGWQNERWQTHLAVGRRDTPLREFSGSQPPTIIWRGVRRGDGWQFSALGMADPDEQGASVSGRWQRGSASGSWEGVWRQPPGGGLPWLAGLAQVGWRPHGQVYVECLMGWADDGPRPVLAQKHPVLAGWSGQGVAVRGTWRPAVGLGLKMLIHHGDAGAALSDQRAQKSLLDLQLSQRWSPEWRLDLRWRRGGEDVVTYSERFPWQPAALAWRDAKDVVSFKLGWRGERDRWQLVWRRLALSRVSQADGWVSGGGRSLLGITGNRKLSRGASLRWAWTWSWGDPVDLVSAVVPFSGYVLPRHWGRWRSEFLLGAEWPLGAFAGRLAVTRRSPEFDDSLVLTAKADIWAGWAEIIWLW